MIRRLLCSAATLAVAFAASSPVIAGIITTSQTFGYGMSQPITVPGSTTVVNGALGNSTSVPLSFAQFNTLGGSRQLDSVTITLAASMPTLSASVSSECELCSASATNVTVFSVGVDTPGGGAIDFSLLPLTQTLTGPTATGSCGPSNAGCTDFSNSPSQTLALAAFAFNSTPAQLGSFIGSGAIAVSPLARFTGTYTVNNDNSTSVSASTVWNGSVTLTYNYTDLTPSVPEPASLLLVAIALTALGGMLARRRPNG